MTLQTFPAQATQEFEQRLFLERLMFLLLLRPRPSQRESALQILGLLAVAATAQHRSRVTIRRSRPFEFQAALLAGQFHGIGQSCMGQTASGASVLAAHQQISDAFIAQVQE